MMKNIFQIFKQFLFAIVLLILVIPVIQTKFTLIKVLPLKGAITSENNSHFTVKSWLSGDYQKQKEVYLNESFGFRNIFVRLNNQIAFTLFNKAKANGVIIGKKNYLYEQNYINAYYGRDFNGEDSIISKIVKLKFIQDTLAKLNKNLIIILAPGKGTFFPEYFPDELKSTPRKSNYQYYAELTHTYSLNCIDFNKYFVENKAKSKYPLFPQHGIHWSDYGSAIAADSIIRYIENLRGISMPHLYWNDIEIADSRESDNDIEEGMNLLFKLKQQKMAYPKLLFESDSLKTKPSALVIADSFFWQIYGRGITTLFSKCHFWFCGRQIYPESFEKSLTSDQIDLKSEIEKHDIIIIMATEANLRNFGWEFIDKASDKFVGVPIIHNAAFNLKVSETITNIRNDKKWHELIQQKALERGISLDSMMLLDAIWTVEMNMNKK